MSDRDDIMTAYIEKYIVKGRDSDAAEDSAGAAWRAYQEGEFEVPQWFVDEYHGRGPKQPGRVRRWYLDDSGPGTGWVGRVIGLILLLVFLGWLIGWIFVPSV